MTSFLILIIGLATIYLGYKLFGKWFNHLSIYAFVWMNILYLYELKLIYFVDLSLYTWLVIIAAFISFLIGTITVFTTSRNVIKEQNNEKGLNKLFNDNGETIKHLIYLFSIIGILSALQHWQVLLNKYGTIINVFLNAYHVYRERSGGELEGVIPYVWLIIYPAIFLAGIYTAYKGKLTIATILPIIALLLKEIANLSRAGILFGFSEFVVSFLLFRHLLNNIDPESKKRKFRAALGLSILILFLVIGAAFVKSIRQTTDSFKGTSSSLSSLEGGSFISPSIYFYGASQVVVLNQFLEADRENVRFGNSTFFTIYRFLSKFELVEEPSYKDPGYYTPHWSNTGTYLRELYGDFGYVGIFVIPYLIGLLSSLYWFKFYLTGKIIYLVVLTQLYIIIVMSFFVFQVRTAQWTVGGIMLLLLIPIIERIIARKKLSQ